MKNEEIIIKELLKKHGFADIQMYRDLVRDALHIAKNGVREG